MPLVVRLLTGFVVRLSTEFGASCCKAFDWVCCKAFDFILGGPISNLGCHTNYLVSFSLICCIPPGKVGTLSEVGHGYLSTLLPAH